MSCNKGHSSRNGQIFKCQLFIRGNYDVSKDRVSTCKRKKLDTVQSHCLKDSYYSDGFGTDRGYINVYPLLILILNNDVANFYSRYRLRVKIIKTYVTSLVAKYTLSRTCRWVSIKETQIQFVLDLCFISSTMWRCVTGLVVAVVQKEHDAFETSETVKPATHPRRANGS
jgi:hypothetical protein